MSEQLLLYSYQMIYAMLLELLLCLFRPLLMEVEGVNFSTGRDGAGEAVSQRAGPGAALGNHGSGPELQLQRNEGNVGGVQDLEAKQKEVNNDEF